MVFEGGTLSLRFKRYDERGCFKKKECGTLFNMTGV